jgi:argininosuccinate lyase
VRYCIENGKSIPELSIGEFRQFSELIDEDIYDYVTLEASVNARRATGGTAREAVERELTRARQERKG